MQVAGREVVGLIGHLRALADDADDRVAGDHERGAKECLLRKLIARGHFAIVFADEIELTIEVHVAPAFEAQHFIEIVESFIGEYIIDKRAQLLRPITLEAGLASQDRHTPVVPYRFCQRALANAEWNIGLGDNTVAQINCGMRVGAAGRL